MDASLSMAAFLGRFDLARRLIEDGADPGAGGWQAFMQAAAWQDRAAFEWIASRAAPPEEVVRFCERWTAANERPAGRLMLSAWRARREADALRSALPGSIGNCPARRL